MTEATHSALARVSVRPGAFDRLDPIAALVRWWTKALSDAFAGAPARIASVTALEKGGKRRLRGDARLALDETDAFVATVHLPEGAPGAHAKALALRVPGLAPIASEALVFAAHRVAGDDGATYHVAMARRDRLSELENLARRRGVRRVAFHPADDPELPLVTPRREAADRRAALVDMGVIAAALVAAVAAVQAWTAAVNRDVDALVAAEQAVRAEATARGRALRDTAAAQALVARGVLDRRIGAVAEDLAALNAATPDAAYWTRVRWQADGVRVTGASAEASAAIEALSAALATERGGWSVSLSGPVRGGDREGLQTFEVLAVKALDGDDAADRDPSNEADDNRTDGDGR